MNSAGDQILKLSSANSSKYRYEVRTGTVSLGDHSNVLTLGKNDGNGYCDAQIDDYHHDGQMRWRPPVQMTIRARFSHPQAALLGTAGFGFWNDPFGMTQIAQRSSWRSYGRLPQAVWYFFGAPPTNLAFASEIAGYGWKAATVDASEARAKALLPFAPFAMLVCRWRRGYQLLWPIAQRVLKIEETLLPVAMDEWHTYSMEWQKHFVRFRVDDQDALFAPYAPRGPLGFVAWVDNQFMVATPQGHFRSGLIATETQWMEIDSLEVRAG